MPRAANDPLWRILPSSSTKLEKDLLRIAPFGSIINPAVNRIISSKRISIPDNWLPWLVLEYGLGRLQEFVPDVRTLIDEGLEFNRLIGTPGAISKIFEWMEIEAELWEEPEPGLHAYEFQVKLNSIPEELDFCKLARGMDIAKPVRGRFRRIFNDAWNVDRFVLDNSMWGDILDNYSGVWAPDLNVCGGTKPVWLSLAVHDDLSPEEPLTEGGIVGGTSYAEVVNTTTVQPFEWVTLDDEHADPSNFYPNYMYGTLLLAVQGNLVDELGQPIIDEMGEPILYNYPL